MGLTGCGGRIAHGTEAVIVDPNEALGTGIRATITDIELPDRTALIVAVVTWQADEPIGAQADKAVDELSAECADANRCKRRGIFVLIDPVLFPVLRVGSDLRLPAMWKGATFGEAYVAAQLAASGMPASDGAVDFARYAVDSTVAATRGQSWLESLNTWSERFGYGTFATEYATTSYPTDSWYHTLLVRPLLTAMHFEREHLGSWWGTMIFGFAAASLIGSALATVAGRSKRLMMRWIGLAIALGCWLLPLAFAVPWASIIVLQSGARLEDTYDLAHGLSPLPPLRVFEAPWAPAHSWLLTIAVLAVGLARWFANFTGFGGPLQYVSPKGREALLERGLIGEWQDAWGALLDDDTNYGNIIYKPLLRAIVIAAASYAILPKTLVVCVLLIGALSLPRAYLHVWRSVRRGEYWEKVASGEPSGPFPLVGARYQLGSLALSLVLGVGVVALVGRGGHHAFAAPAVPGQLLTASPPPVGKPSVTLRRGAPARAGYWYDVELEGFQPGSTVRATCHDSGSAAGFVTVRIVIRPDGTARASELCYSGDGPGHWVTLDDPGASESEQVDW